MKIYSIYKTDSGEEFYATKTAALQTWKKEKLYEDKWNELKEYTADFPKNKKELCNFLNGANFADEIKYIR